MQNCVLPVCFEEGFPVNCPYCGKKMTRGRLCGISQKAVVWLPEGVTLSDVGWASERKIQSLKGRALGEVTKIGFFSKKPPDTFLCPECDILLSKL